MENNREKIISELIAKTKELVDAMGNSRKNSELTDFMTILLTSENINEVRSAGEKALSLLRKFIEQQTRHLPIPANQITYSLSEIFLGKKFVEGEFEENFTLGSDRRLYSLDIVNAYNKKTTQAILFNSQELTFGYNKDRKPINTKSAISKDLQKSIASDIVKEFFNGNPSIALKHFLGILAVLRKNQFSNFEINDHLDLLGYKRENGKHSDKNKNSARLAVELFSSFEFCLTDSNNNPILDDKKRIPFIRLFSISVTHRNKDNLEIEAFTLTPNPLWYEFNKGYTQIHLKLAQVNVHKYPYVVSLGFLFSIKFKLDKKKILKYRKETIYNKIDINAKNQKREIDSLHKQFDYMTKEGFIKSWKSDSDYYYFTCGDILGKALDSIEKPIPPIELKQYSNTDIINKLQTYLSENNLSLGKFCSFAGIDKGNLSKVISGKIGLSKNIRSKILDVIENKSL